MYKFVTVCTCRPNWNGCKWCDEHNTKPGQLCTSNHGSLCDGAIEIPVGEVTFTRIYRLRSMPRAQAYVEITVSPEGFVIVTLVSYVTPVLQLTSDGTVTRLWFGRTATTSRHINRFTTEFLGYNAYHDVKNLTEDIPSYEVKCRQILYKTSEYLTMERDIHV